MQTTVYASKEFQIVAADIADARERLRAHLDTEEFWFVIHDGRGLPLIEEITKRHYWTSPAEDMFVALVPIGAAGFLSVAVFRRALMLAPKFKYLLDKHGVILSTAEIVRGGAVMRVIDRNQAAARKLAISLGLGPTWADGLAMRN